MTHDPNCIFCLIIEGKIPASKVYENEEIVAFLDIGQVTKGHTLVIPKEHQANIFELQEETAAALFRNVPKVANAIKKAFNPVGLNLLNNNGELAYQSVFHYHIHLIPRYGEGDGFGLVWKTHENDYSQESRDQIAQEIGQKIED